MVYKPKNEVLSKRLPDGTVLERNYNPQTGYTTTSLYHPNSRGVLMIDGDLFPSGLERRLKQILPKP